MELVTWLHAIFPIILHDSRDRSDQNWGKRDEGLHYMEVGKWMDSVDSTGFFWWVGHQRQNVLLSPIQRFSLYYRARCVGIYFLPNEYKFYRTCVLYWSGIQIIPLMCYLLLNSYTLHNRIPDKTRKLREVYHYTALVSTGAKLECLRISIHSRDNFSTLNLLQLLLAFYKFH
jgi:hypothetical protein